MTLERGDVKATLVGSSLGAGRVLVTEIDGYPVEVSGNFHTIALVAEDKKGSVARITPAFWRITTSTSRRSDSRESRRGGDAFMVIECDESPGDGVRDELRSLDWVRWARRLDKVSGGVVYRSLLDAIRDAEASGNVAVSGRVEAGV